MIPQTAKRSLAVPLTRLHYAVIGLRLALMKMRYPPAPASDPRAASVVDELRKQGWALVKDYLSAEYCRSITVFIDELIAAASSGLQEEYAGAEHRLFGAETRSPKIAQFFDDAFLRDVAEQYMGTQIVNICTLANKSLPANSKRHKVDRWHRDSFGRQIKAIAYLVDVDETSGAFEFLTGSNQLGRIVSDIRSAGLSAFQWRISDEEVASMCAASEARRFPLVGPRGSVVFVDTSVIHRATPVLRNSRYALTNYYVERARYRKSICDALGVDFRPGL